MEKIAMTSRRTVIIAALASGFVTAARAQIPPAGVPDANSARPTILELGPRGIEVSGKAASVLAIRQPDGTFGISTKVGKPFRVRVENKIDEP